MSYGGGGGFPPGFMPVVNPNISGLPFNIDMAANGPRAGLASTETVPTPQLLLLDCAGPDSVQNTTSDERIHLLQILSVNFTIPGGVAPGDLPAANVLFLTFDIMENGGCSPYSGSTTSIEYIDGSPPVDHDSTDEGDPFQTPPSLMKNTVAIIEMGDAAPGETVRWTNHLAEQVYFTGKSTGLHRVRVKLCDNTGAVFTPLEGERVFIKMAVLSEKRR